MRHSFEVKNMSHDIKMSSRLKYDTCATQIAASTSKAPLDYILDTTKFESTSACRRNFVQGGNEMSRPIGMPMPVANVDIESDLLGITRKSTKCDNVDRTQVYAGRAIGVCPTI